MHTVWNGRLKSLMKKYGIPTKTLRSLFGKPFASGKVRAHGINRNTDMDPSRTQSLPRNFFDKIETPTDMSRQSCFLFSLPKAGSVLLNNIFGKLSAEVGLSWVDLPGYCFQNGILPKKLGEDVANIFRPRGYCYGGFRCFAEEYVISDLDKCKSILLVRDPRDILVSDYFSMRSSHPPPGGNGALKKMFDEIRVAALEMDIDQYVISMSSEYLHRFESYRHGLKDRVPYKLYRYEDVIFEKRRWIASMMEYLGWEISPKILNRVASEFDAIPRTEDETRHIRQVTPGDHKRKLRPGTISDLNKMFSEIMQEFGYPP